MEVAYGLIWQQSYLNTLTYALIQINKRGRINGTGYLPASIA